MHFALPPRKTSNPPPYARAAAARSSLARRRKQFELGGYLVLAILTVYLFYYYAFASRSPSSASWSDLKIPPGAPEVVIVTVLDTQSMSEEYITKVKANRMDYAKRHGYVNFFTNTTLYDYGNSPSSWALVPAVRHALTLYPDVPFIFALSPNSLIMSPSTSLVEHILDPPRLESLMLKDVPVVPPDSVIHTFSHLKGDQVGLVLTQDADGLGHGSFLLRKGDWATFFLDTWFDPLYRGYNFQKAEAHALEHIVQWHPTILAKLVLVPQRIMNSYNIEISSDGDGGVKSKSGSALYEDGDFLIRFPGCESFTDRNCEKEMGPFFEKWSADVKTLDKGSKRQN